MHLCLLPTKLHCWHVVIQKSILVLRAEAVLSAAWMSQPEKELTCNSLQNLRNLLQNPTLNDLIWWKKLIRFAVCKCLQYKRNTWNWSSLKHDRLTEVQLGPIKSEPNVFVKGARCQVPVSLTTSTFHESNEHKSQNHHTSSCYGNFQAIPSTSQLTFRAEACWVHHNKECLPKPIGVVWQHFKGSDGTTSSTTRRMKIYNWNNRNHLQSISASSASDLLECLLWIRWLPWTKELLLERKAVNSSHHPGVGCLVSEMEKACLL